MGRFARIRTRSILARTRRLAVLAMASVGFLATSCTPISGQAYQVDLVPLGYHFHIYQVATAQVWVYNTALCGGDEGCTLAFLHTQVDINGLLDFVFSARPETFFDDDTGDFEGALNGEVVPPNPSINDPGRFGCLSGYRNTQLFFNDGDWYGAPWNGDWCRLGQKVTL